MKLVKQLTLVTLQTAHHGSTSPRIASTQRNHASRLVSTDFCNKICHKREVSMLLNDLPSPVSSAHFSTKALPKRHSSEKSPPPRCESSYELPRRDCTGAG